MQTPAGRAVGSAGRCRVLGEYRTGDGDHQLVGGGLGRTGNASRVALVVQPQGPVQHALVRRARYRQGHGPFRRIALAGRQQLIPAGLADQLFIDLAHVLQIAQRKAQGNTAVRCRFLQYQRRGAHRAQSAITQLTGFHRPQHNARAITAQRRQPRVAHQPVQRFGLEFDAQLAALRRADPTHHVLRGFQRSGKGTALKLNLITHQTLKHDPGGRPQRVVPALIFGLGDLHAVEIIQYRSTETERRQGGNAQQKQPDSLLETHR